MGYSSTEYKKNRKILLSQSQVCVTCGNEATTANHIVPISKGGGDELSNLEPMCHQCNSTLQDRDIARVRLPWFNPRYK
jgi:5-methylcytosine-specific restriction endonuclease McrA